MMASNRKLTLHVSSLFKKLKRLHCNIPATYYTCTGNFLTKKQFLQFFPYIIAISIAKVTVFPSRIYVMQQAKNWTPYAES